MRVCPFESCGAVIQPDRYSCDRHWFLLSRESRSILWNAFLLFRGGLISEEELRDRQADVLAETLGG